MSDEWKAMKVQEAVSSEAEATQSRRLHGRGHSAGSGLLNSEDTLVRGPCSAL